MFHRECFEGTDIPYVEKPEEKPKTKFKTRFEPYQNKNQKSDKLVLKEIPKKDKLKA